MVLSNGRDTLCYRTTSSYFYNFAFLATEEETVDTSDELADTGFDSWIIILYALLMGGFGAMLLVIGIRRETK